jgi:CheY-like chemotaxis protein
LDQAGEWQELAGFGRVASGMLSVRSMIRLLHAISRNCQEEPVSEPVNPVPLNLSSDAKTVLVAEDEPVVREFMASALRDVGYNVLQAENGEEALRLFEVPDRPKIDLLLTDIVMPVMGGKELAYRVGSLFPETKIAFCSAYPEKLGVNNRMFEKQISFLQKPATVDSLKLKVQEVLSDAGEGAPQSSADNSGVGQQERLPESPSDGDAQLKCTILVIDDDPLIILTVKTLLAKRGFNVLSSCSSPKGLDMIRYAAGDIRIVVLDYNMPNLNGDETLKFVKQLSPNAMVVGLTGMQFDSLPKSYLNGVDKLLTKPVVADQLISAIDELLGNGQRAPMVIQS